MNFAKLAERENFVESVKAAGVEGLLVTGDISEAEDLVWQLERLQAEVEIPIVYVLGNHDFYHGSVAGVRAAAYAANSTQLHYLTGSPPIHLHEDWFLCGDDGWGDATLGDYWRSNVRMHDFSLIQDLAGLTAEARLGQLRRLGQESAERLSLQLRSAVAQAARHIIVLTHLPPFRESCWYDGEHSDDNWAPFFTCHAVGEALERFCSEEPNVRVLVLCGHTHSAGRSRIAPNLDVWTGEAEYGVPKLEAAFITTCWPEVNFDWNAECDR